ncbi:hypothetical protein [Saccharopolyspora hattusasensis]|uniref:hypothetical protein n=1 Tax=Saccharopolyspora hattusasensis TaxID=1128679 RepID=UPI003D977A73
MIEVPVVLVGYGPVGREYAGLIRFDETARRAGRSVQPRRRRAGHDQGHARRGAGGDHRVPVSWPPDDVS